MTDAANSEIDSLAGAIQEGAAKLAALRRAQPPVPVEDHALSDSSGTVTLGELFGTRQDLIVIHNMGRKCPYCTMWADGLNGLLPHLENRAAVALVSPDEPETQRAFAESRGWNFRMISAAGSSFTRDMGYEQTRDGQTRHLPGYSTFVKRDDGSIERIARDSFGPGDLHCGAWHMFEMLAGGTGDWRPAFSYD